VTAPGEGGDALLAAWLTAVRDGGVLVTLDRGEPSGPARRALCAGLTDVAQRQVGRTLITRGRVVRF
jgi:hypothetical protein